MKIHVFSLGELQTNCYLLEDEGKALVIDPGDDAPFILEELQRKNLELVGICLTHGHFDHAMAVGEIQMSFPVPLYMSREDMFLIYRLEKSAQHFLDHSPVVVKPLNIEYFTPGELHISNFAFTVIPTPGHTPGSVCLYFPGEKNIFTGDTLFSGAVGRTDFAYGDKKKLHKSLELLFKLPDETEVYPGHGEITYIMTEKESRE